VKLETAAVFEPLCWDLHLVNMCIIIWIRTCPMCPIRSVSVSKCAGHPCMGL